MKTTQYFQPLDAAAAAGNNEQDYTIIVNASLITDAEWRIFLASIKKCDSNEEIIFNLEREKTSFLFTSEQLMALIETTLSVKTRIAMISHLGPRLVDPKSKANQFIQLFRYAEEKERVESILKMRLQVLMATASLFRPGTSILGSPAIKRPVPNGTTTTTPSTPRPVFLGIKGLSVREKIAPGTSASSSTKSKAILSLGGGRESTFTEKDKPVTGTPLTPASSLAPSNEGGLFNDRTSGNVSCSSSISSSISSSSGSSKKYSNYSEGVTTTSGRSSSYYSTPSKAPTTTTMEELSRTIRSRGKVASLIATFSRGGVKGISADECDECDECEKSMKKDGLDDRHLDVDEEDAGIALTWSDSPAIKTNISSETDNPLAHTQRQTPNTLQYDNSLSIFACFSFLVSAR